ncbi:hypothetical protein PSHT_02155 [Puccinia striiformis]|uniref:Uncharacterized protein n=2 Tax=Puccinia striiformis TaxID=27350 RepID=A0A0L0UY54_9BASI|nr:hypothetical protein PSTG_14629 [Puccinia striiformis f. sp. tritici PST-78]POW21620.1 hypothetical protein PSHT_02155 [Puccinia striiformis]
MRGCIDNVPTVEPIIPHPEEGESDNGQATQVGFLGGGHKSKSRDGYKVYHGNWGRLGPLSRLPAPRSIGHLIGSSRPSRDAQAEKKNPPLNRGYHSADLVASECIILGGSGRGECFSDIHVPDLYIKSLTWIQVGVEAPIARLAHTRTQVGSDLGGHDGEDYTSEVKSFNLVTLQWEPRTVKGQFPPRIGYHTATLHDSRLIIIGGFDGRHVYDQVWCLELASLA